jgi:hypothetical protein
VSELSALLSLLDDPDPGVQATLAERLTHDRALLDRAWAHATSEGEPPAALVGLVLATDAEVLVDLFAAAEDLERGCWLLPRLHRPRVDYALAGAPAIDALAARLPADADGGEVARFLCEECGFAGDARDYHDPRNSYLPEVLARRLGLPIALTALWLLIGRRRRLEIEAIATPGHVVGRWRGGFVDLFAGGKPVSRDELEERCRAAGAPSAGPYLAPASDRALLRRMARNLVGAYFQRGDRLRATIAHGLAAA